MNHEILDERTELERLRAENAELRARTESAAGREEVATGGRRPRGRGWRWALAITLLVLGSVALAMAVPAIWTRNLLLNTDRYTETVAPLADEPAIRESVSVAAVDGLFEQVDVEGRAEEALPPEAAFLVPPLTSELRDLSIQTSERALETPQFEQLWVGANRRMHSAIVPVLEGESGPRGLIDTQQGTISLDLTEIVTRVKAALVERGVTIVERVPDDAAGGTMVLFQSDRLSQIQSYVSVLQSLAIALPIVALLALAGAVLAAPDHRRGLLWAGVSIVLAMVALGAGIGLVRTYYLDSVDRVVLSAPAAAAFFDVMVRFLRTGVRIVAAVGALVVLGAALAGPSRVAVAVRGGAGRGLSGAAGALGLDLGPSSEWVERHRAALDIALLLVLAVVLLAAETVTPGLVLALGVAAILGVAFVELIARAHATPPYRPSM